MTHVTYRLTATNRDQLRNPTLGNRVRAAFTEVYKLTSPPPEENSASRVTTCTQFDGDLEDEDETCN